MPSATTTIPFRALLLEVEGTLVFPRSVATVEVSRPENLFALRAQRGEEAPIVLVPRPAGREGAGPAAPPVGTLCRVLDRIPLLDGSQRLVVQGIRRVVLSATEERAAAGEALWEEPAAAAPAREAMAGGLERVQALVRALAESDARYPPELDRALSLDEGASWHFIDRLASRLPIARAEAEAILVELDPLRRLGRLEEVLRSELTRAELANGLEHEARERVQRGFLREQLELIQGKLGVGDPVEAEARELERSIRAAALSEAARRAALRELAHFRRAALGSAEAGRIRNWIEWVLELPWQANSPDPEGLAEDFARVAGVLDRTHTGLEDVKNRVREYLAVRRLGGAARGTVLCFNGPPGTGKTSMGRALAQALGRRFVHVPVGGVSDEVELRGRHHTQPGAVPGRVLQGLHRAGTSDPVVLIDEIDKIRFGGAADTGGVLLEILDPEQNREFFDHYLGVGFDLSQCIFLVTSNDTEDVPEALLDRLEVIDFGSYTEREKLAIAREHLIPRARAASGLSRAQFRLTPGALVATVRGYTEEAGVRQLQRTLDSLARKAAVAVVRGRGGLTVHKADLRELLGPANVDEDLHLRRSRVGIAAGLAWTSAGGSMLPIEALAMPGTGRIILTGSVGEVMRESVQTATSYVRTRFKDLELAPDALESLDVHLHFPSGATPKDGPSAGIAIATSLVSLLTRTPARHDLAMSGELSLHGAVLPVGGLREKLLAALRSGVRAVVLPARNGDEVLRLPPEVRQGLRVHLVDDVREVLALALMPGKRSRMRAVLAPHLKPRRIARRASGR